MSYNPELYIHDLDRKALAALKRFPIFLKLQEAYITNVNERQVKIANLATAIRLSDKQLPEVYNLLFPICEKLGIEIPELYMVQSENPKDINAYTGGITQPYICVTSELVKQFPLTLMGTILAHECGHISCKHSLYHSLARSFAKGITNSPLARIPEIRNILSEALVTALLFWDRCSELSADRAAALCDGTSDRTIDMLLKIHGFGENINREEFIKQALDLKVFVNDSKFFSEIQINGNDIGGIHKAVNRFIENYAKSRGVSGSRLPDWIGGLEKMFPVPQDNVWKGEGIGITPKNHHLADLAHHPTPLGLISALMVQFLRVGTFVNKDGEWHFLFVKTEKEDVIQIAIPALITGILNWLMFMSEKKYEDENEQELPRGIHRLAHIVSSTPEIVEIIKCTDNWFGHLVSDMGGSKNTAGHGMGIPGVLLSLLQEVSSLPGLKDSGLPGIVNDLYVRQKIDLRRELLFAETLRKKAGPVIFNEVFTRIGFMLLQLKKEITENKEIKDVNWRNVMPFNNRSEDRCLMISTMTFNMVDTADAAFWAAVESEGNWVLFSRRFVSRYNYVGTGRAALAIVKEYSNEKKEEQLIYERMLLMEEKAQIMYQKLQKFKSELEERLTMYLAEDIETFMNGFDLMNEGLASGTPNLVIKGNVEIQKILGRKPQFESQEEFDEIMASDVPVEF